MNNYRGSSGRGGTRYNPDYTSFEHDDRLGGPSREIRFNDRGRNNNYSRGRGSFTTQNRYSALGIDFGNYNQNQDMRPNKSRSYNKKSHRPTRGYYKPPRGGPGPRSHLDEDDDVMVDDDQAGSSSQKRFSPYGSRPCGGRNNYIPQDYNRNNSTRGGYRGNKPRSQFSQRQMTGGSQAWFKVQIPHGAKENKDFLLKGLLNVTDVPFVPKDYHVEGNQAVFHIQDSNAANALKACSRRITNSNGLKVIVLVNPSRAPTTVSMNPDIIAKLKVCMSARYDPAIKSMNLSNLENDAELSKEDIQLCFNKHSVAKEVMNIINENIPELESLDLQNNKLTNLSMLADLPNKAPNITRLNLGKNMLRYESELQYLSKLSLLELCLDGNPLCDKFSDETAYVSAVRKKFPKVLRLDGHDLPPPITFDLDVQVPLPQSKGSLFGSNPDVKGLVCQFIQQYFTLFDSSNRQSLLDAYHDQAVFSIVMYSNGAISGFQPRFNGWWDDNRNLLKAGADPARRNKVMRCGRLAVAARLSELPATEHDTSSFIVDVIHLSPLMLTFSVQGIFREPDSDADNKRKYVRSFSRIFVTVPQGAGISILNEELSITNATAEQKKKVFQSPDIVPGTVNSPAASGPAVSRTIPAALTAEQQVLMSQQFSAQSGMNMEWSAKCLQENEWDYEASAKVFTDLQVKGQIPPEAFIKS